MSACYGRWIELAFVPALLFSLLACRYYEEPSHSFLCFPSAWLRMRCSFLPFVSPFSSHPCVFACLCIFFFFPIAALLASCGIFRLRGSASYLSCPRFAVWAVISRSRAFFSSSLFCFSRLLFSLFGFPFGVFFFFGYFLCFFRSFLRGVSSFRYSSNRDVVVSFLRACRVAPIRFPSSSSRLLFMRASPSWVRLGFSPSSLAPRLVSWSEFMRTAFITGLLLRVPSHARVGFLAFFLLSVYCLQSHILLLLFTRNKGYYVSNCRAGPLFLFACCSSCVVPGFSDFFCLLIP